MDEPLYAHLRHPILKVLHSHGITKSSSVSINVLTDVLDKYLKSLLGSCQEYANHAGRTSLKVNDVIHSLDEMGTTLDDLRDYLEIDAGIRGQEESNPKEGIQRYAYVVGPKKEAELNEFKESLRTGLRPSQDAQEDVRTLRYTRLPTPDPADMAMDVDSIQPYPPSSYDDSDDSVESTSPQAPPVQLPLSPISNSPPDHSNLNLSRPQIGANAPEYVLPFLPPFPAVSNLDEGDASAGTSEERQRKEQERQVEELKKQEEAAAKEKAKEGEGVEVVQTIPANYIVPASYDVSKLQGRGAWHLPSLSASIMNEQLVPSPSKATSENPFKAGSGTGTTEDLLAVLHSLAQSDSTNHSATPVSATASSNNISTNPLRHKVSLVFLGTTPARFNTPDTLFGLTSGLAPTPRPAHPLPAYVQPLEVQPGLKGKGLDKGKNKDIDPSSLPVPSAQSRSIGVTPPVVNAVTGTTSRISTIGKSVLPKPTLLRTKRLAPPPAQKRDEKVLLYHTPNPPLPAPWNMSVSGTASQYVAGHSGGDKGDKERNPYGVAEATLSYTWDWHTKSYWEGLERLKGGFGIVQTPHPLNSLSSAGAGPIKDRTVPKISVNVPGRRQSTLSSTASASAVSNSALIAKLPGLGRSSPSRESFSGGMQPPPVPTLSGNRISISRPLRPLILIEPSNQDIAKTPMEIEPPSAIQGSKESSTLKKEESEPDLSASISNKGSGKPERVSPSFGNPDPPSKTKSRSISKPSIDSIDELILTGGSTSGVDRDADADLDFDLDLDLDLSTGPGPVPDADADIDADIAEVMGDAEQDVDADIAEALGEDPEDSHHNDDMSDMEEVELDQAFGLDEMPESPSTYPKQPTQQNQQSWVPPLTSGILPGPSHSHSHSHSNSHSHSGSRTHSRSNSNPNGVLSHQDQSLLQAALETIEDTEDMDEVDLLFNATAAATTSAHSLPSSVPSSVPASTSVRSHTPTAPPAATAASLPASVTSFPSSIDNLGVGEPPIPPGPGSAFLLDTVSPLDNTLPLATSALRSTTTPLPADMIGAINPAANPNASSQ